MSRRTNDGSLIDAHGPAAVVAGLRPFLSEHRRERIDAALDGRCSRVQLAIEEPYDPRNAAAAVRSAEALGAGSVHVINAHARVLHDKKATAGTHRWIDTVDHRDFAAFLGSMRGAGIRVAAACVDAELVLESLPIDRPICLLFGNEHRGLSDAARAGADLCFRIPIFGFAESFNLSVAAAISLYSLLGRIRSETGRAGDLDAAARERLRALWYLNSVDARLASGVFGHPAGTEG